MIRLNRYELGEDGRNYIEYCIAQGMTLSERVRDVLPLSLGQVWTCAPAGTPPNRLVDFRHGGLVPLRMEHIQRDPLGHASAQVRQISGWLIRDLAKFATQTNCIAIAEDQNSEPESPRLGKLPVKIALYNREVYHVMSADQIGGRMGLHKLELSFNYYAWIVYLCDYVPKWVHHSRVHLSDEDLTCASRHICGIIVGAYDGEGYLMWKRQQE